MALIDKKVSEAYSGRDIASLSDRPNEDGLTAQDLKARFDQLGKEVIPKYNQVIDILVAGNIEEIMSAGQGINVIDVYDTYLEFITAHPTGNINDIYGVRVAPNIQTYIWGITSLQWETFALIGDTDKIGNLTYTENNYIVDGETVTDSLNKLDIALKDVDDTNLNVVTHDTTLTGDGTITSPLSVVNNLGWNILNATLTYASADSPTFVANTSVDLTSVISVGMKIKLTQTTVKYFIVTAITSTTITLYGGTDYTLINATITLPFFSSMKAPFGFPLNISKWTISFTVDTTTVINNPGVGIWYNRNTYSFPIGLWKLSYLLSMYPIRPTDGIVGSKCTLSTTNNGETNSDLSSLIYMKPVEQCILQSTLTDYFLNIASKTNYYLNLKTDYAGLTSIQFWTAPTPRVYLVCAYL